jgi:uncharacterized protein YfaS (alpha-2-macroglobulin family)
LIFDGRRQIFVAELPSPDKLPGESGSSPSQGGLAMSTGNTAPSRRRFWICVLCFALANAGAWIVYDRHVRSAGHGLLRVEAFEPGDDAVTGRRPTLRWRFNTDVIPTAAYGHAPATVSPAVAGKWNWEDPRTLTFTPDSDLPEATRVSFTLADTFLRGPMGATLPATYATSIRIEPLKVESVRQIGAEPNDRAILELRFNDRVLPSDVLRHLTVTDDQGKPVACQLFGHPPDRTVRLRTDSLSPGSDHSSPMASLKVTLSRGLAPRDGDLGISEPYSSSVALSGKLAALELTAEAPLASPPILHLRFNGHVAQSALQQVLSVEPKMDFTLQINGDSDYSLLGDFKPQTRYTVTLAATPTGTDPAEYPQPGHLSAFVPDRQSGVWLDNDQGYLSSAGNRTLLAHTVNIDSVRVSITRVYDNNLVAWRNAGRSYSWNEIDNYSRPIAEKTIPLSKEKNVQHDVRISLDELLPAGAPHNGVYRVQVASTADNPEPTDAQDDEEEEFRPTTDAIVTLSDIGLTAKEVRGGLVVWATSLRSAKPLANIHIRAYSNKNQPLGEATTDANGLARISDIHTAKDEQIAVMLADRAPAAPTGILGPTLPTSNPATPAGNDLTWLALRGSNWEMGDLPISGKTYLRTGYDAYLYTDRGVYRPDEIVHIRAILRDPDHHAPGATFPVRWQIRRPDQHLWQSKIVMLDADGAAALDVQLLPDLPTGQWTATLDLPGSSEDKAFGSATFNVEEFVPSRMKVALSFDHSGRAAVAAGPITAQIQSDYLFGRPAAGLTAELATHFEPAPFAPAGWSGWAFGDTASVHGNATSVRHVRRTPAAPDRTPMTEVALDGNGHYVWSIDPAKELNIADVDFQHSDVYAGPWRLTASSGVREAGGRAVTAVQQIDIDALDAYLAIRRDDSGDATPGSPCPMQIRLVRPDGQQSDANTPVVATLYRATWNTTLVFRSGRFCFDSNRVLEQVKTETRNLADGKTDWSPTIPSDGEFVATVRDSATGAFTSLDFFATDGSPWNDNISRANPEHLDVRLLPDGATPPRSGRIPSPDAPPTYAVGQTDRVAIGSPFPGRLLLTVETDDIIHTQVIDMHSTHEIVSVPITEACRPNAFITATVVRAVDPNAKWQAHRAFGTARLRIDPADQTLHVAITAPTEIRPLQSLDVNLAVTDSAGQPTPNAAVTVAAVDEGICMLTDFPTPDPIGYFNSDRALGVHSYDLFDLLMPEVPLPDGERAVGGDRGDMGRHITPIVAHRFKPVALAWQTVHTDANGLVRASFSVPEFEGRLRVMAVAYDAAATGSSDAPVTVRSPILAQSTWPRFAAPGDAFAVPIVLFNNTDTPGSAIVTAELEAPSTAPALVGFGPDHESRIELPAVDLPALGQKQISLPAFIGHAVGVAKLRLHVAMNGETYDEHLELPIRPPSPRTQFAGTYLATPAKPTTIAPPATMLAGTDALAIHITPWPTLHLNEALDYLDRYPFGCVEQTTSECFPLLALHAIGKYIDPHRFDPGMVKVKIDAGIMQLLGMQTTTGGLAMWPGEKDPWPWGSVYAAHFLVEARSAGFAVPEDLCKPLLCYVRRQLDEDTDDAETLERQSYAAFVLAIAGTPDRASLSRLTELAKSTNPLEDDSQHCMRSDAALMLSCAWAVAGRHDLAEQMLPDTLPAPRTKRETADNIGSPIRDRALVIYTLARIRPDDPRLPALVQGLADSGLHQTWDTQECAFATLAIGTYLEHAPRRAQYDSVALLSSAKVLATAARGESIDCSPAGDSPEPYSVKVTGPADAAAYVSWMQSGVPLAPPADSFHGLTIHRQYLTASGAAISQNRIATGELVRVRLTLDAPANEQNLVIEDLLPAGLEAENSALKTSAAQPDANKDADTNSSDASDSNTTLTNLRIDVRDDRVIFMGGMPDRGTVTLEYLARAVTPGIYAIPPVRAEAMYDIAENGLSGAGGKFTVTAPPTNVASVKE